jgi:hypothetical protein
VLEAKTHEIMERWKAKVRGTLTPESMPPLELVDHLPEYLAEIVTALRRDAGLRAGGPSALESTTAAEHGAQRLRLGFSLDSVVREYGALRDAIIQTARDAHVDIGFRELQVISDAIISGIARAVSEYTIERDAELMRHANEHFAFIAHELRNPLSSAMYALQALKQRGEISPGRTSHALERSLNRMQDLIDQTLRLARIASGIELKLQETTVGALFEDAEFSAISESESKGVAIRCLLDGDRMVELDVRLVRSALSNLLTNAVKYSRPGGTVELRGRLAIGRLSIEIEDCCGGLPPGKVEEAFAPFVRLDKQGSGFGLGLAIAKQAVDAHGGTIRVQNLPGKGCVFVLEFPVSQ